MASSNDVSRRTFTADDWADAALAAIGEGGIANVAIEPLAKRLGTTKGSFYHHFPNRQAVLDAALKRWEAGKTDAIIDAVEALGPDASPRERMRCLFTSVPAATSGDAIEITLMANKKYPDVAAALQRVTERRIKYVAGIFRELGFQPGEARRRALAIYMSHIGQVYLMYAVPMALPQSRRARKAYLESLLTMMMGDDQVSGVE